MRSFDSTRIRFAVIGCVDIITGSGTAPLAIVGQTTIKIRLGRYIDAAEHESESLTTLPKRKMIVVADSNGQQEGTVLGSRKLVLLLMNTANLFMELVATYRKHGWTLRGALMQPATLAELKTKEAELLNKLPVNEATFNALWFSRPSHNNREAWELRLLEQTQYALFETFEADETEAERDEMKLEMEARLREYAEGK